MDSGDAAEISLAENIVRLQMHSADQYEAFKALADQGKGPQEIAARFGCSPMVVKQRLKLASVDPRLTDPEILDRLVIEKLEAKAEAIRAEGWKWVIISPTIDREKLRGLGHVYPEREPPTEEQQAEIDALAERYKVLENEYGEDPPDEIAPQFEEISDKIDALSEGTERWSPDDLACAGCVVGIGYGGELAVERGFVKPEDRKAETGDEAGAPAKHSSRQAKGTVLSDKLVEDLTAHRTAALRAVLAGNADLALVAVVHALALPLFFPHATESCLELSIRSVLLDWSAEGLEGSPTAALMADRHEFWRGQFPNYPEGLWDWLLAQDNDMRLRLLAYCAGCSVNAVRKRHERADTDRFQHADRLAVALGLDMAVVVAADRIELLPACAEGAHACRGQGSRLAGAGKEPRKA